MKRCEGLRRCGRWFGQGWDGILTGRTVVSFVSAGALLAFSFCLFV